MKIAILIPARLASTRLPGKMLLAETGRPLIQHTYEAARRSRRATRILVATDDSQILNAVQRFGGEGVLTNPAHISGTDRIAEVAAQLPDCDLFVNLQGDEPEMDPAAIDLAIEALLAAPHSEVATLICPIRDKSTWEDPACVKVVQRHDGRALYFSRSPIPFVRDWRDGLLRQEPPRFWQHLGLYVYRRDFLLQFSRLPQSALESSEVLEQLRILEAGYEIALAAVAPQPKGIDTPADYRSFVSRQLNC